MRLSFHLLGTELFALSWERETPEPAQFEHDHTAAQVERAEPFPVGFAIDLTQNP